MSVRAALFFNFFFFFLLDKALWTRVNPIFWERICGVKGGSETKNHWRLFVKSKLSGVDRLQTSERQTQKEWSPW